jgi:hypothetical protein
VRLTCPHLVKEIDKFEYAGDGIGVMNAKLNDVERGKPIREDFLKINDDWMRLRNDSVNDEQRALLLNKEGMR